MKRKKKTLFIILFSIQQERGTVDRERGHPPRNAQSKAKKKWKKRKEFEKKS